MDDYLEKAAVLERETREKVSESLSKIEIALSEWDAAKEKPGKLEKRIEYLRLSHRLLSGWATCSLRAQGGAESSLERLRDFTEICSRLEKARDA